MQKHIKNKAQYVYERDNGTGVGVIWDYCVCDKLRLACLCDELGLVCMCQCFLVYLINQLLMRCSLGRHLEQAH